MPSVSTLKNLQKKISLKTGINDCIKGRMTEAVSMMEDEKEKVALLMWDEVSLSTHVDHSSKEDRVVGVEEWDLDRSDKLGKN